MPGTRYQRTVGAISEIDAGRNRAFRIGTNIRITLVIGIRIDVVIKIKINRDDEKVHKYNDLRINIFLGMVINTKIIREYGNEGRINIQRTRGYGNEGRINIQQ